MEAILISIFSVAIFLNAQRVDSALPNPDAECGVLKEEYLYNEEPIAELDEFPWIGRIAFTEATVRGRESSYKCLAVLISRRHVLASAQCFRNMKRYEPTSVLLGDWNTAGNASEPDCNEAGECAPPPLEYEIDEIVLHADYDSRTGTNDIAVLALTTEVALSDHVQPICLPSTALNSVDFVSQYLPYAGFEMENAGVEMHKKKTLAHVLSTKSCHERYNFDVTDKELCVTCNSENTFQAGAPLMGVSVENSKPRRFYLIGLLSHGREVCSAKTPDVVQRVSPYLKWISDNVV